MLETHRMDLRIIAAAGTCEDGLTVSDIHKALGKDGDGVVSLGTIKRHLPGLMRLGRIRGEQAFRDEKIVTLWRSVKVADRDANYFKEVRRAAHSSQSAQARG